jgi:hypothetical protein
MLLISRYSSEIQSSETIHEKTALINIMEARGHMLLPSVKCHPEMAGNGIEYSWGQAERFLNRLMS